MDSKEPELVNTLEDGIRVIRFNRPKRKNALSGAMLTNLRQGLREAAADSNTIITVITGTGDYFTSGNDLANFTSGESQNSFSSVQGMPSTDEEKIAVLRKNGVNQFEELIQLLIEFPKPIIGVVNGPAIGVGVTMLPLLDIVYASDRATFTTPFVKTAQSPEGCSSYLFPRIMGPGKAAEMLLFSKKITAEDALKHHLVTEVFPDGELHKVWPMIKEWSKLPPNSLANAKQLLSSHNKEFLLKVNSQECDRLALMFTKEEFMTSLMEFFSRKSKL